MSRPSTRTGLFATVTTLFFGALVAAMVSSCSGSSADAVELPDNAIILDVRTPEEFAGGHLDGARLLDFNSGEFSAALPTLDPNATYVVYCRSGNRSGQAVAQMQQQGFSNVTNLGSLEDAASATGIEITR